MIWSIDCSYISVMISKFNDKNLVGIYWFSIFFLYSYCKRGDLTKKCRFGYSKPYFPVTFLDSEHRCTYKRDVGDVYVNNYSPYPLDDFRTSMDVQYNGVRYLQIKIWELKEDSTWKLVNESLCNLFIRFQDERENPFNQTTPLYRK